MKKIVLFSTLILLMFIVNVKEVNAASVLGITVMDPDVSSYPGSGKYDASGAIASYNNWGLRMYFVDAKTGKSFGVVKDFVASSPIAPSNYLYYGAIKKDIYNLDNISPSSLKTDYENFVIVKSSYYSQALPTDPGKGGSSTKDIEDFFKKLAATKVTYKANAKIENALQLFLIEYLKVPANLVESVIDTTLTPEYYVVVEPVRYFRVIKGYLALTSTESPLVINAKNYTTLYNGIDGIRHPSLNEVTYNDVIPTAACLNKIANGTMPNDETSSVYRNCKSIAWWLHNTLYSYTPRSVVHETNQKIGSFTYSKYNNKGSYNFADVVGVKEGLGIGFVDVFEYFLVPRLTCEKMTQAQINANLLQCCSDPRAKAAPTYNAVCAEPDIPEGSDPNPLPNTCDYYVSATYPKNCNASTEGKVSDINDWKCIFESPVKGGTDYSDHYIKLDNNKYCSIFCREDIEYKFPSNSFTVLAGNHFTVGSNEYGNAPKWNPVYIAGNAICRTNGIDHDEFLSDWNKANPIVATKWNELQKEIAREKSVTGGTVETNSASCSYMHNTVNVSACEEEEAYCVTGSLVNGKCANLTDPSYRCVAGKENNERYDYIKTVNSFYEGTNYKQANFCSNNAPTFTVAKLRSEYNEAINTRDGYLSELNQCVDYQFDYKDLLPKLQMEYEEAKYGLGLELVPNYEDNYNTTLLNGGTSKVDSYVCDEEGKKCELKRASVTYPTSDDIIHQARRIINYSLKNDVYRYVNKFNGLSTNIPPIDNYLDVGYGNLPIDYNREAGIYDINITYGNLGENNKFNRFILNGIDNTPKCPGTYDCTYNVNNEILCDPDDVKCDLIDLSVIFRPVSLTNPFPGLEGKNRLPGSNWTGYESLITKNRGVNDAELYTKREPMYEITLDANTIKKIRDYNNKNGYTDFNLSCKEGLAKECISSFLTTLKNGNNEASSLKISTCARTGNEWNDTCKIGG